MPDAPVDFRHLAGAGAPARDLKAGEVIFREGDPAHELFIIQSGEIEIRLGRVLETLPQYGIFGEMALIDSSPRSATTVAVTDTKLVSVSEKQFLFLVSSRRISRSTSCASWRAACARRTVSLGVARLGSHSPTPHANGKG